MTPPLSTRRSKTPPPGETGQEALYLRSLSDRQVVVQIKLRDGETVRGWIEYFDDAMLRLKQFLLFTTLDAAIVTTPKLFVELEKRFRALTPFLDFLNAPLVTAKRRVPDYA